jgi:hypothetical protein
MIPVLMRVAGGFGGLREVRGGVMQAAGEGATTGPVGGRRRCVWRPAERRRAVRLAAMAGMVG